MYNITSTTPAAIFSSIGRVTVKNETSQANCVGFGVDNMSVNAGNH